MGRRVIEELLRAARMRGMCAEEVLERYSFPINEQIVSEILSGIKNAETGIGFFKWAAKQKDFEHSIHTCNSLIRILVDSKRPIDAHRLFNDPLLARYNPSVDTYNLLIRGYCESGLLAKAFRLLEEMQEREMLPNEITHGVILKGLCDAGKTEEAIKHFRLVIETSGVDTSMYNILVDGFCRSNRLHEAFQLFEEMIDMGWKPTLATSTTLMGALCKGGKIDQAMKVVMFQKEAGEDFDIETSLLMNGVEIKEIP